MGGWRLANSDCKASGAEASESGGGKAREGKGVFAKQKGPRPERELAAAVASLAFHPRCHGRTASADRHSARAASSAARGSRTAVTERPSTSRLEPSRTASATVATRRWSCTGEPGGRIPGVTAKNGA